MILQEEIDRLPIDTARKVCTYLRKWAYECAIWERYAIADYGSHGDKCRATQRLTRIERGTGS